MVRNSGNSKLKHDKLKPKIFESHESTLRTRFANPEPEPIFDRINHDINNSNHNRNNEKGELEMPALIADEMVTIDKLNIIFSVIPAITVRFKKMKYYTKLMCRNLTNWNTY